MLIDYSLLPLLPCLGSRPELDRHCNSREECGIDRIKRRFKAKLWAYQGKGAWHFVTLPKQAADEIRFHNPLARGFMPIGCEATIGKTNWKTSVFPDSKSGSYVLAVKADVRKAEKIKAGDIVHVAVVVKSAL